MRVLLFTVGSLCSAVLPAQPASAQERDLIVTVRDETGALIRDARVAVVNPDGLAIRCAPVETGFACSAGEGNVRLEIQADGFSPFFRGLSDGELEQGETAVTLAAAGIREQVVVTANRVESRIGETPASIAAVDRRDIAVSSSPILDDILRQVPGFSTFRRSGSQHSNPTTQGVSLRGAGGSGAGRTLVLLDGIPLNDPFGGWVQWSRVAPIGVETVEVLRGGASSLYGSGSLSGTINILARTPDEQRPAISAEMFGGSQNTFSGSAFAGISRGAWAGTLTSGHFYTRGYIPVSESERGPVDSAAGVRASNLSGYLSRSWGEAASVFIRPTFFKEKRTNGTLLQTNSTGSAQFVIGGRFTYFDMIDVERGRLRADWRIYGGTQVYDQTFSAVTAGRTAEIVTRTQRSPSRNLGYSGQISAFIRSHTLALGAEGREVRGSADEVVFIGGSAATLLGGGGRERSFGIFAQDIFGIGERVVIAGSLRYDVWLNENGYRETTPLATAQSALLRFPDRRESAASPRISILLRAVGGLSFHAAASRSFRAPTLNELYRGFRVGNVVTNANEGLHAERAANFEGGISYAGGRSYLRASGFYTAIDRAISNVTISETPELITRERQNAGSSRTAGVEVEMDTRLGPVSVSAGYVFADARVTEFPSNPGLVDNLVPQVARHQFTFQTRLPLKAWTFALQARASGAQFDDDLNQFRLEPFVQIDIFVSRRFASEWRLFAAVENIFNSRYSVGRTPVRTVSAPAAVRIGVRWK